MTGDEALRVLDQISDPRSAGKLTRTDYVFAQQALEALQAIVIRDGLTMKQAAAVAIQKAKEAGGG